MVEVCTKYKRVDQKVKPVVIPLPSDAREVLERARREPSLRDPLGIRHVFTPEIEARLKIRGDGLMTTIEIEAFCKMIL